MGTPTSGGLPRLSDAVRLRLLYEDASEFGSVVSGRIDESVRERCAPIAKLRETMGLNWLVKNSLALLEDVTARALAPLYESPGRLREECLHPPPSTVVPRFFAVDRRGGERPDLIAIDPRVVPDLARWIGKWQVDARPPGAGPARRLWEALDRCAAFSDGAPAEQIEGDIVFGGHAMARMGGKDGVLVDPFLLPGIGTRCDYAPLSASQLAPSAILITHSHPDHFDIGSLMRFGVHVPIFVPEVARESLLAIDMEARLREVGFCRVSILPWGDEVRVGATRVASLPFYGEQPTTSHRWHAEVRNSGNLYLVETGGRRYALTADAGEDASGKVADVASTAASQFGPADAVFCGYRSWALYPVRYLFTSVARYLLFVPRDQWLVRQKIMNDADDAIDACEHWGAPLLLPYADGGAPWYWELGLGPRLDQPQQPDVHFDPRPEHVRYAARRRSSAREGFVESPVRVEVPRPGDVLKICDGGLQVRRLPGHAWPYEEARA